MKRAHRDLARTLLLRASHATGLGTNWLRTCAVIHTFSQPEDVSREVFANLSTDAKWAVEKLKS